MTENIETLRRRICELESINDQLITELKYLDDLLKKVGFKEGLLTLKEAAVEILDEGGSFEEEG